MARSKSGGKQAEKAQPEAAQSISLLDAKWVVFTLDGEVYNVEDAPDEVFDTWVRQRLQIGWTLQERVDAINTILADEKSNCALTPAGPEEEAREQPEPAAKN